jgi:VRR-NUC domain
MARVIYIKASEFRHLRGKLESGKTKRGNELVATRGQESYMQEACVTWFRLKYPSVGKLLFSIPNGGLRTLEDGKVMKAEGMMKGVADLLLLVPRGKWHGLAIELKSSTGRVADHQQEWGAMVMEQGYPYVVCKTKKEFMDLMDEYMGLT